MLNIFDSFHLNARRYTKYCKNGIQIQIFYSWWLWDLDAETHLKARDLCSSFFSLKRDVLLKTNPLPFFYFQICPKLYCFIQEYACFWPEMLAISEKFTKTKMIVGAPLFYRGFSGFLQNGWHFRTKTRVFVNKIAKFRAKLQ